MQGRAKCLTRLVLPIRYRLCEEGPGGKGQGGQAEPVPFDYEQWIYRRTEPKDIEDIWRRSAYFTADTSYALFRRAHWYELKQLTKKDETNEGKAEAKPCDATKNEVWTSFSFHAPPSTIEETREGRLRKITVEIEPPKVVLFDAESSSHWRNADSLFQVGFLLLDCHLSAAKPNEVYLEDLLEFNERARCLWLPYKGCGEGYLAVMAGCRHLWTEGRASDEKWNAYQQHLSNLTNEKRMQLCAAREKQNSEVKAEKEAGKAEADAIMDWLDRLWPPLGIWSAALNYCIQRDGDKRREWFTTSNMRSETAAWAGCCAESSCRNPSFPEANQPVPKHAAAIERYIGWLAATDYRAFVWTYAYTLGSLSGKFGGPKDRPERFGHWIKLMNVDSVSGYWDKSAYEVETSAKEASPFEQGWARERTYNRWAHYGTYYGISPHAGAMLTEYSCAHPPYGHYFVTLYFDQVLLLLYLRVMAFQLSIRMARLSAEIGDVICNARSAVVRDRAVGDYRSSFREVRQQFMSFSSLYQFPLLSTQQQGVEMYTLFRKHMDIDELYRDVSNEIDTWDRVMAQHNEETVSRRISLIAFFGLPVAIVTLLLTGMQLFIGLPFGSIPGKAGVPRTASLADQLWAAFFEKWNRDCQWLPTTSTATIWAAVFVLIGVGLWCGFLWWTNWIERRRMKRRRAQEPQEERFRR